MTGRRDVPHAAPPKVGMRLLGRLLPEDERSETKGDLEERFQLKAQEGHAEGARIWFWFQILHLVSYVIKDYFVWSGIMFKSNLIIAWRNVKKNKGYSLINLAGLAIGITASVLIFLYARYELSYDRFHEGSDRIYRVACGFPLDDRQRDQIGTPAILSQLLRETVPEVEAATKLSRISGMLVSRAGRSFLETNVISTDANIFSVFSLPLLSGDAGQALSRPGSVVLSRSTARKWFGDKDPLHQTIALENRMRGAIETYELTVTGVAEDLPATSHFHFGYLVSAETFPWSKRINFGDNNYATYFSVRRGTAARLADQRLQALVSRHFFKGKKTPWRFWLQPLADIHLTSNLHGEFEPNGSKVYVLVFLTISLLIILIASINFMNLATARYSTRLKEVGIRKVVGSGRRELMGQFLAESVLYSLLACLLSLVLLKALLPGFRTFVGKPLQFGYFDNVYVLPFLFGYSALIGVLSGLYPSLFFASFRPAALFSRMGVLGSSRGSKGFRSGLVVFQFTISVFLIIGTLVIARQLEYVQDKRLGYDREQVLVVKNAQVLGPQMEAFKETAKRHAAVLDLTQASALPGNHYSNWGIQAEGDKQLTLDFLVCDPDYLATLRSTMAQGRFFSRDHPGDSSAVVINEQAARDLGYADPLGRRIKLGDDEFAIIGVVRDFHYQSLQQPIKPLGMILWRPEITFEQCIAVRIRPSSTNDVLRFLEKTWDAFSPALKFESSFLDEDYAALYRTEQRAGKITLLFSGLAIAISLLGLLGLAAFSAERRRKEIGIRKTLGASEGRIVALLSRDHLKLVLLANVFAWPLAYAIMNAWLRNFYYRIGLGLWMFGLAGLLAFALGLLIVGIQALKAAWANPVDSLKYE